MGVSWRIRESNPRPRACWARALPTELIPHWIFRHLPTTSTTDLSYPPTPPKDIAATVKVPLRFATQLLVLNRLPLIPYRSNLTLSKNWHFSLLLRPWIEHGASRSSVLRSPNWAIEAQSPLPKVYILFPQFFSLFELPIAFLVKWRQNRNHQWQNSSSPHLLARYEVSVFSFSKSRNQVFLGPRPPPLGGWQQYLSIRSKWVATLIDIHSSCLIPVGRG